ncbi:MAG: hemolysin family protein [Thermodesulfobacteriota bacterium]
MSDNPTPTSPSLFRKILHYFGLAGSPDPAEDLSNELQELIEEGEEHGLISTLEGEMLTSIFDFRDTQVKEIMTPATEIISSPLSSSPCDIIKLINEHGFSRIPIYDDSPDRIEGFIHAKDLLSCSDTSPVTHIGPLLTPMIFVNENDKVMALLQDFQANNTHLAIVADEFGATRGLVTLEDILEEIVGEIADESDKQENLWRVIDDNTVVTDAKIDLDAVEAFFNTKFPEGPYESIGGFIIDQHGRIPERGATVSYPPLTLTVLKADQRRIKMVKIQIESEKES